jgi:hypothetical protein
MSSRQGFGGISGGSTSRIKSEASLRCERYGFKSIALKIWTHTHRRRQSERETPGGREREREGEKGGGGERHRQRQRGPNSC